MSIGDDQIELLLDEGWRPEDLTLHTTGGRHPEQVSRQESGNASYWDSSGTSSMSSTVTGSSSRDWSAERSSSSSSMSPPPVAMGRGDGGPAVQTLGSTPSANCQPLSISVSTNPVASQSVASKAIAAQQLWTSRIHATNKFAARNNCTAHLHKVREWLWHSKGHTLGHQTRCAAVAMSRWIDVDDLQTQAVVDQLLHRHRPDGRDRLREIWRGLAAGWGSTTPNVKPAPRYGCWPAIPASLASLVGSDLCATGWRRCRRRGGGALARRRRHAQWRAWARVR